MTKMEMILTTAVSVLALLQIAVYIKGKVSQHKPSQEENTMKFYDVQSQKYVNIAESKCTKKVYKAKKPGGCDKYAFCAVSKEGHKLTLFCSKEAYDKATCPKAK